MNRPVFPYRTAGLLAGLLLAVSCTGCASRQSAATPAATPQEPGLRLLEPGVEPRHPLRLKARVGSKHTATMTYVETKTLLVDGVNQPDSERDGQSVTATFEVVVLNVTEDGGYRCRLVCLDARVDNPSDTERSVSLAGVAGASAELYISSYRSGVNIDALSEDASAMAFNSLAAPLLMAIEVPLPAEPIGLGARWSMSRAETSEPLKVPETAFGQLTGRQGSQATVSLTIDGKARPQTITRPDEAGGERTLRFSLYERTRTNEADLDPDLVFPARASVVFKRAMRFKLVDNNDFLDQRSEWRIQLSSVQGP